MSRETLEAFEQFLIALKAFLAVSTTPQSIAASIELVSRANDLQEALGAEPVEEGR